MKSIDIDNILAVYNFVRPVLDIGFLTFVLYKAYQVMVKTNSIQILKAAVILLISYFVAYLLKLDTLLWIFKTAANFCQVFYRKVVVKL